MIRDPGGDTGPYTAVLVHMGQSLEDDLKGPEGTALHVRDRWGWEANKTQKMAPLRYWSYLKLQSMID